MLCFVRGEAYMLGYVFAVQKACSDTLLETHNKYLDNLLGPGRTYMFGDVLRDALSMFGYVFAIKKYMCG